MDFRRNNYFFVPFALWCVFGLVCILLFSQRELFSFVNSRHTDAADRVMFAVSELGNGLFLVPVGLLGMLLCKTWRTISFALSIFLCTLIPSLITRALKYTFPMPRPMTVYAEETWVHRLNEWPLLHNNSFPSGHTTGAFAFFCMMACALPQNRRGWGLLFFLVAVAVAWSRLYLAAHFFADVYAGSMIGVLFSSLLGYFFGRLPMFKSNPKF